jgi:hypothetical protein
MASEHDGVLSHAEPPDGVVEATKVDILCTSSMSSSWRRVMSNGTRSSSNGSTWR